MKIPIISWKLNSSTVGGVAIEFVFGFLISVIVHLVIFFCLSRWFENSHKESMDEVWLEWDDSVVTEAKISQTEVEPALKSRQSDVLSSDDGFIKPAAKNTNSNTQSRLSEKQDNKSLSSHFLTNTETVTLSQESKPVNKDTDDLELSQNESLVEPKNQLNGSHGLSSKASTEDHLSISSSSSDRPVSYSTNKSPAYPLSAIRRGSEGKVMIRVKVSARGELILVELSKSSGSRVLDDAALIAVRGWSFSPAIKDGSPVTSEVVVPVVFKLTPKQ